MATEHDGELQPHRLSWADFDELARGGGGAAVVRVLRRAERSRRLLLMRALADQVAKEPELCGPLPSWEDAWELLARVQRRAPGELDAVIDHPYTGSWAGYTTRLLRNGIAGVGPAWAHLGHVHAIAAAAAIRAKLDFEATVPVWSGFAALPTLGVAHVAATSPHSVARVRVRAGRVAISATNTRLVLPADLSTDAPGWWGIRRLTVPADVRLSVRLDDVDPYRGLYEPVLPQRLDDDAVTKWQSLLSEAWQVLLARLPERAATMSAGLDCIVPRPMIPFRLPSASTGEAFGSAVVSRPEEPLSLAATLVHEFQHIRLSGLLHLANLRSDDPEERIYAPWRDDPRPLSGVLQGVYAFFGVTEFWRSVLRDGDRSTRRRAAFEFALARAATWRTARTLRHDHGLTDAGRRFLDGVIERLRPWQEEPVPAAEAELAAAVAADHRAMWRIRHMRPSPETVAVLAAAWSSGERRPSSIDLAGSTGPTPVPDGAWSPARTDMIRLGITTAPVDREAAWADVPEATPADIAYVSERYTEAIDRYRAQLADDPDHASAWVGLGLACRGYGRSAAGRALLSRPELVRAVHRHVRATDPVQLADWIGRIVN
ncbi:HEXXH motif domain-containing protein [Kutzneria chonburiensis]|uniref:HEXXH motif-containing putative peptide modification protein n=1 Tax=Kutzneria chonburiensis TaxID=1483604 RepID=A0ABV6N7B5_9PSEU|nr:HEXXH motif-containing putative peptide modification protein [Kutzneria chonburiensis]